MAGRGQRGTKALVVALLVHLAVVGGTATAFVATEATTFLAASALAVVAAVDHLLLLVAGRRVRRTAEEEHPFGSGRERFYWSFALTVVLALLGAVAAVDEGVRRIRDPEDVDVAGWAIGVLAAGCVLQLVALRVAAGQANQVRGRATWRRFVRHAEAPTLPVVLVEALLAAVGLLLAGGAVATAELADEPMWDGIGTVAVGGVMAVLALVLLVETRSLLIGHAARAKDVETIRAAVEIDPAVQQLLHMRTQHQGPEELLVGMKVELDHTLTFPEVSEVVNRIERNVRRAVPMARLMYIEPDVTDARRAAPTIGEHVPDHAVPEEIRAKQRLVDDRGALGAGIPLEDDL